MPPLPNVRVPWGVAVGLALGLAALAVMAQLQSILAGMHIDGGASYDFGSLWSLGPDSQHAIDVVKTWQAFAPGPGFHSAGDVLWAFVLVDTPLFVLAYVLVLWGWLRRLDTALVAADAAPPAGLTADESTRRVALIAAYRRLVRWCLPLVLVLALCDFVENFSALGIFHAAVEHGESFWFGVLYGVFWLFTTLKWALTIVLVIAVVATTVYVAFQNPERSRQLSVALVVVRPHVFLIGLFAAAMFVSDQSADAFRRWPDEDWHGAAATLVTVGLALVILLTARRLLDALVHPDEDPPRNEWLAAAGVALLAVGVAGHFTVGVGLGLTVPGALLLAIGALSALTPDDVEAEPRIGPTGTAWEWLPAALSGAPLILLGLAVMSAAVPEVAYSEHNSGTFVRLALAGLTIQLIGWIFAFGADRLLGSPLAGALQDAPVWQFWALVGAGVGVLVLWICVVVEPWATAEQLGTHATFAAASAALALLVFLLVLFAETYSPPRVFALLRLKRVPIFLLLAIWLVGAAFLDRDGVYYDARIDDKPTAAALSFDRDELTAESAFTEWTGELNGADGAVPMLFVSAAGGGIRAAYWTAAVLSCVLEGKGEAGACSETEISDDVPVFATSGISGGSLGLAAYVTHDENDPDRWYDERLGDDYTAPLLAWAFFVDFPLSLVRRDGGTDRAEVLERAWERSWPVEDMDGQRRSALARGIYDRWGNGSHFPLLLLNATKVQDGCRFNGSVHSLSVDVPGGEETTQVIEDCLALLLFERGRAYYVTPDKRESWTLASTDDLSDFLCDEHDVRLSTAVLMSARFPWVAPSGRVPKCDSDEGAMNLVDGGYFDTSGASPLVELFNELEHEIETENQDGGRCIVPVFLQIDTGYSDVTQAGGDRPWESVVPLNAVKSARNAREANARQAAGLAFSGNIPGRDTGGELDRFAHIYPRAHPGSKAPLGWTLSSTARNDLSSQLRVNAPEIAKVRGWFDGGLRC